MICECISATSIALDEKVSQSQVVQIYIYGRDTHSDAPNNLFLSSQWVRTVRWLWSRRVTKDNSLFSINPSAMRSEKGGGIFAKDGGWLSTLSELKLQPTSPEALSRSFRTCSCGQEKPKTNGRQYRREVGRWGKCNQWWVFSTKMLLASPNLLLSFFKISCWTTALPNGPSTVKFSSSHLHPSFGLLCSVVKCWTSSFPPPPKSRMLLASSDFFCQYFSFRGLDQ